MSQSSVLEDRKQQAESDFRYVVTNPQGLRFVATLMVDCGLYSATPNLGMREVALRLRRLALKVDPKLWTAIEAEIVARRIEPQKPPKENEDE